MKKVILLTAIAISSVGCAQSKENKEVPKMVTEAFAKEYPNTKVDWDIEEDGFEAEFKLNGKEASADYDKNGNKLATEIEITESELPTSALTYLKTNYPKSKIKETAKITDSTNVVTYEAEIKIDGKNSDLLFDANGSFLKIVQVD
ncbi:PepSY-like domain-containing protein [Flavobacterium sp. XS1P32]|uniref:PepSY-like domain-containing protein n=1 Tax=Flavobacterium sp. XS1P32 TaxID=3401726 RepID=UPI003AAC4D2D